jgi:hypothetical protein
MVRCHGNRSTPCTATVSPTEPPELIKVIDQPIQNDYIALLLGDDEEQMSADRSVVTFLAVPTDSLQVGIKMILVVRYGNNCDYNLLGYWIGIKWRFKCLRLTSYRWWKP